MNFSLVQLSLNSDLKKCNARLTGFTKFLFYRISLTFDFELYMSVTLLWFKLIFRHKYCQNNMNIVQSYNLFSAMLYYWFHLKLQRLAVKVEENILNGSFEVQRTVTPQRFHPPTPLSPKATSVTSDVKLYTGLYGNTATDAWPCLHAHIRLRKWERVGGSRGGFKNHPCVYWLCTCSSASPSVGWTFVSMCPVLTKALQVRYMLTKQTNKGGWGGWYNLME